MEAAGAEILFPMEKLAVRGLVEVVKHYREIVGIRKRLRKYFLRERPALFIGIDSPDFNLGLEIALKRAGDSRPCNTSRPRCGRGGASAFTR